MKKLYVNYSKKKKKHTHKENNKNIGKKIR